MTRQEEHPMENSKRPETMARINTPELAAQFID